MNKALGISAAGILILLGACERKATVESCYHTDRPECKEINEVAEKRQQDINTREMQADVAAEQARLDNTTPPPADYQRMTKGLPVIK